MSKYIGYLKAWTGIFLMILVITVAVMLAVKIETGVVMIVAASIFGVWILGAFGICFFGMRKTKKADPIAPGK